MEMVCLKHCKLFVVMSPELSLDTVKSLKVCEVGNEGPAFLL